MNDPKTVDLDEYYSAAADWSHDKAAAMERSVRTAWIVAGVAALIALAEAVALIVLTPLKTVVPYTLLVDRQTGYVEALQPLERATIAPDRALVRSFLVQYVIARESFDIDQMQTSYRKVALWSADDARRRYIAETQASNPLSPLAALPRRALVNVQVRSVSSVSADTALVRFTTVRTDPGAQAEAPQHWAALIKYRFSGAEMTAEDRLTNPLGFQVVRYRKDAETLPELAPAPTGAAPTVEPRPTVPTVPTGASGPRP